MKHIPRILLRGGAALGLLLVLAVGALGEPKFAPGEMLVSVPRGTARERVEQLAAGVNATIVRSFGTVDWANTVEAYQFRIRGQAVPEAATLAAVQKLRADPLVTHVSPNWIMKILDSTPNDPRYPEQWGFPMINMPKVWDFERGKATVTVAVVDNGFDVNHPDLGPRLLPGRNFTNVGTSTDLAEDPAAPHGTHVAGTVGAVTNNGTGVAGTTWEGVRILPIKVLHGASGSQADVLAGLQFVETQNVQVVNISLGTPDVADTPDINNPMNAQILRMARNGMLISMGAGNEFENGNPPFAPANLASIHENLYCVTAVNAQRGHAYYSSARPYSTIAAPGGDITQGPAGGILSTWPGGTYESIQGTSMAAPHISGVLAILMSVGGVRPEELKAVITSTAQPAGGAVPNPQFGHGIVDAFAAYQKVAVGTIITEPAGTGGSASAGGVFRIPPPIETLQPRIALTVRKVQLPNLVIKIDDQPITIKPEYVQNVRETVRVNGVDIPVTYDIIIDDIALSPGPHKIEVIGTVPGRTPPTVSDVRNITITPKVLPAGRSMISIPYFEDRNGDQVFDVTPEAYFGSEFRLARWIPPFGPYVFYSSFGPRDIGASFAAGDVVTHFDGDSTPRNPIGLGFWADFESQKPVLTRGRAIGDRTFVIPLRGKQSETDPTAWNMVGDPFPYDVPFNALLVDTPEGRLSIRDAANRGYILPSIYSYDGVNGYTFRTLPDGALRAWESHWIGVARAANLSLVVPPVGLTRAAALPTRAAVGGSGWSLRLSATSRELRDTYNFIGVSEGASDGYDPRDVQKPPMVSPFVSLAINNADWGGRAGAYAQDIRSAGGLKSWKVFVNSDQPNSTVTVGWEGGHALPRNVSLTIRDETTGVTTDMRTRSSLQFNTGADAAPRAFTITARPGVGSLVRISNLNVQRAGRSGTSRIAFTLTGDATYQVQVLNATGQSIGTIATRAAGAGEVSLLWNGKDAAGRSVPAGTYIIQVRATGPDGDVVKAIQPFAVIR